MINIFNSIVKGFTVSAKNLGVVCKSVFVGFEIIARYIFDLLISACRYIKNQVVAFIKYLLRLYLSFETGIVKLLQISLSIFVKIRWGFVIIFFLTIIYYFTGIFGFLLSLIVCIILMIIGYSDAKKEEDKWDERVESFNDLIERPLRYVIRIIIILIPFVFTYYFNTSMYDIIIHLKKDTIGEKNIEHGKNSYSDDSKSNYNSFLKEKKRPKVNSDKGLTVKIHNKKIDYSKSSSLPSIPKTGKINEQEKIQTDHHNYTRPVKRNEKLGTYEKSTNNWINNDTSPQGQRKEEKIVSYKERKKIKETRVSDQDLQLFAPPEDNFR